MDMKEIVPTATDDPAVIMSTETKKIKSTKSKTPKPVKPKSNHPPVSSMVKSAIKELKERNGSSVQAIKKYLQTNFVVDIDRIAPFIRKYLKSGVIKGELVQAKGKGASGSFKLNKTHKPESMANSQPKKGKKKPTKKQKQQQNKPTKQAATKLLTKKIENPKTKKPKQKKNNRTTIVPIAISATTIKPKSIKKTKKSAEMPVPLESKSKPKVKPKAVKKTTTDTSGSFKRKNADKKSATKKAKKNKSNPNST